MWARSSGRSETPDGREGLGGRRWRCRDHAPAPLDAARGRPQLPQVSHKLSRRFCSSLDLGRKSTMTTHRQLHWGAAFVLMASGALAHAQSAATLPADLDPDSRARIPYLQRKDMDERSQKIFDTLPGRSPEGVLRGPLAFAAYNPAVAKALFDLHNAAVGEGTLDAHVRELAIMVASRETNYSLEWNAHEASALKAGVDPKVIDVVRRNGALTGVDEKDALVIRFGRQMLRDKKMDSATFAKAVQLFGRRGAMDMVAVMNTYAVSGFFAIAVDEHMPPGRRDLETMPRP
jgi:4-carboxymuconolactone decarboxylase